MNRSWRPAVTVAAVIERDGRFLLVEETTPSGIRLNQPAGHLEPGETLEQAAAREALEECGYEFMPEELVGTYLLSYTSDGNHDVSYLRFTFCGRIVDAPQRPLDPDILRTVWMTRDEVADCRERHRSPLLLQCIDDYLAGRRAPLSVLSSVATPKGSYG